LRWAGGKRQVVKTLAEFLPSDCACHSRYHEPFLGAGSLFFWVGPARAVLSDANQHLVDTYKAVRDDWELVARHLGDHAKRTSKRHYYRVREQYNSSKFSAAQAARFIYLNKTCFNGIFRVNTQGKFNVPYGWKEPPALPSRKDLKAASQRLQGAELLARSFEQAFSDVAKDDFVYLDPPYPPLNGTAYFTHYTADRFSASDQQTLASAVRSLDRLGCRILMTSADIPLIRRLYREFNTRSLPVTRFITCKSVRHKVSELVITNYSVRSHE
jgi:DNA adenine methylase